MLHELLKTFNLNCSSDGLLYMHGKTRPRALLTAHTYVCDIAYVCLWTLTIQGCGIRIFQNGVYMISPNILEGETECLKILEFYVCH